MRKIIITLMIIFISIISGCMESNSLSDGYLVAYTDEGTELYSYSPTEQKFELSKTLDVDLLSVTPISKFTVIGKSRDEVISYDLVKDEYEILLDIKEDLTPNDVAQVMEVIPNESGKNIFYEKINLNSDEGFQIYSYDLEKKTETKWTNENYSFLNPFPIKNGIYVLRNEQGGVYKEGYKDLYYIDCPKCKPTKVNKGSLQAMRLLDIDSENKSAYVVTEAVDGASILKKVDIITGEVSVLPKKEKEYPVLLSSKDNFYLARKNNKFFLYDLNGLSLNKEFNFNKQRYVSINFVSLPHE